MGRVQDFFKPLEVKHKQEQYAAQGTTGWGNRDIYPIIPEHRVSNLNIISHIPS